MPTTSEPKCKQKARGLLAGHLMVITPLVQGNDALNAIPEGLGRCHSLPLPSQLTFHSKTRWKVLDIC